MCPHYLHAIYPVILVINVDNVIQNLVIKSHKMSSGRLNFHHVFSCKVVLPCALFHCQFQEVAATDGWFLWVTSVVVLDRPVRETEKKNTTDCETGKVLDILLATNYILKHIRVGI